MNKKSLMIIVLLLLVGLTAGYVASTYAKYTSEVTATGTAQVAKWAFVDDNSNQTISISLDQTANANTLVADRIAPGTSGSFDILVSNATSEVGVNYSVKVDSVTNKPANLKFYSDSSFQNELVVGTGAVTGTLAAEASSPATVSIYWQWAYETSPAVDNDPDDTQDGEDANQVTINVLITGTQVNPGA